MIHYCIYTVLQCDLPPIGPHCEEAPDHEVNIYVGLGSSWVGLGNSFVGLGIAHDCNPAIGGQEQGMV